MNLEESSLKGRAEAFTGHLQLLQGLFRETHRSFSCLPHTASPSQAGREDNGGKCVYHSV